jgi:hypothetical protein
MSKKTRTRRPISNRAQQSGNEAQQRQHQTVEIFNDRRQAIDRREQLLPIPARMCRRRDERRKNTFNSRPWWLQVNYNDDRDSWL